MPANSQKTEDFGVEPIPSGCWKALGACRRTQRRGPITAPSRSSSPSRLPFWPTRRRRANSAVVTTPTASLPPNPASHRGPPPLDRTTRTWTVGVRAHEPIPPRCRDCQQGCPGYDRHSVRAYGASWEAVFRSVKWTVESGLKHQVLQGVHAIGVDEIYWGRAGTETDSWR